MALDIPRSGAGLLGPSPPVSTSVPSATHANSRVKRWTGPDGGRGSLGSRARLGL